MKKNFVFLCISILLISSACLGNNQPEAIIASPTHSNPSTSTLSPSKTPIQPTHTSIPTEIALSEPLVLTDDAFEADLKETCRTDTQILGYEGGEFSLGGGSISLSDGKISIWCYGAKHQWIGTIDYAGYTFASDELDPMQFQVVKDLGYEFTGGVGTLTFPDGHQVVLYQPTQPSEQSITFDLDGSTCQTNEGNDDLIQFESPYTSQEALIDGVISSAEEWSNAFCIDMVHYEWGNMQDGNTLLARWWVQNDDNFIYYLVRISKEIELVGVAVDYFWPEYTGIWAHSDGIYVNIKGFYQDLTNWDESNWFNDYEVSPPGSLDVSASVNNDNEFYWFEFKKALNSGDTNDWAVDPGQIIGYNPSDSFLFAIIFDDSFYSRNLQIQLGSQTQEPQPSATRRSTRTPTTVLPETPSTVGSINTNANLRGGPGVVYAVIVSLSKGTKVTVLERNSDSTWFKVEVVSTGKTGWVSSGLVTYEFDVASIPIAAVIPPTPTFAPAEPTQPPEALNFNTHIAVTNRLNVAVTVYLTGPYKTSFTVQSGQTIRIDLPSGTYSFTASAYGYSNLTGTKSWDAGEYTWEFYVS